MPEPAPAEDLLRQLAPQVPGAVVRRYGHLHCRAARLTDQDSAAVDRRRVS